jgi:hypothetical protein
VSAIGSCVRGLRFDVQQGSSAAERSCQSRVFEGAAAVRLVTVYPRALEARVRCRGRESCGSAPAQFAARISSTIDMACGRRQTGAA